MYKRLPPLNSLKSFESAARHLSFTKAADELFVTQAAVSHQIKLLEDFLGVELFIRKNRSLELTEFGKAYFVDINKVLRKLNEATERLLTLKAEPHLAISVPQTFGIQWLVPHLSDFNKQHPEIEVRLKGVDQDEGLLNKEIDRLRDDLDLVTLKPDIVLCTLKSDANLRGAVADFEQNHK